MVETASRMLSSLSEAQDEFSMARRVPVALSLIVLVAVVSLASAVTALVQG